MIRYTYKNCISVSTLGVFKPMNLLKMKVLATQSCLTL